MKQKPGPKPKEKPIVSVKGMSLDVSFVYTDTTTVEQHINGKSSQRLDHKDVTITITMTANSEANRLHMARAARKEILRWINVHLNAKNALLNEK